MDADGTRRVLISANSRLSKYNPLPYILAHDAFAEGSAPLVVESPGLSSFSLRDLAAGCACGGT